MSETLRMRLPLVAAAQAQKHVTVNEAATLVDALSHLAIEDRHLSAPPSGPADGKAWLVAAGATGAWAGRGGELAIRIDGAWRFVEPFAGLRAYVVDEAASLVFTGSGWVSGQSATLAVSTWGAAVAVALREEELTLAGATATTSIAIADREIVLGVSVRVTEAVTGATAFDCGIAGEAAKFGGSLGTSLGSTNIGVIGPTAFYAATPVVLTATGGGFTGGRVRVVIHALACTPPAG